MFENTSEFCHDKTYHVLSLGEIQLGQVHQVYSFPRSMKVHWNTYIRKNIFLIKLPYSKQVLCNSVTWWTKMTSVSFLISSWFFVTGLTSLTRPSRRQSKRTSKKPRAEVGGAKYASAHHQISPYYINLIWDPSVLLCYSTSTSRGRWHRAWARNPNFKGEELHFQFNSINFYLYSP